jgi:hypothetical protein
MRFHKFKGADGTLIWIDLDLWIVAEEPDGTTAVFMRGIGTSHFAVAESVEAVMALVSPPAAPGTVKEELAKNAALHREQRDYPRPPPIAHWPGDFGDYPPPNTQPAAGGAHRHHPAG